MLFWRIDYIYMCICLLDGPTAAYSDHYNLQTTDELGMLR